MADHSWVQEFPGGVTVCDANGIILEMNDKAKEIFRDDGGEKLIGANVLACHPEPARTQLKQMMDTQQANVYTIEKKGVRKLIYQTPWYQEGKYCGFVELSLELPIQMPHFIRGGN